MAGGVRVDASHVTRARRLRPRGGKGAHPLAVRLTNAPARVRGSRKATLRARHESCARGVKLRPALRLAGPVRRVIPAGVPRARPRCLPHPASLDGLG